MPKPIQSKKNDPYHNKMILWKYAAGYIKNQYEKLLRGQVIKHSSKPGYHDGIAPEVNLWLQVILQAFGDLYPTCIYSGQDIKHIQRSSKRFFARGDHTDIGAAIGLNRQWMNKTTKEYIAYYHRANRMKAEAKKYFQARKNEAKTVPQS